MILVDSSVWIDYFNGRVTPQTDLLDGLLDSELIVTGDLIITEVLQGFRNDQDFSAAQTALFNIPYLDMLGKNMAVRSAENYRLLRKKGVTIRKTIDVMIATFCLHYGFQLLHDDRDFDAMVEHLGLEVSPKS
jgi:predicted nucleic acid-binding protein